MMMHPLIRRIIDLLLAVFVTVGMGLSAVQASTISVKMMGMEAGMTMSGMANCQDCERSGGSKGMAACTAPACTAQIAAPALPVAALDMNLVAVRHSVQSRILLGRDTVPDPYPPRTSDIG